MNLNPFYIRRTCDECIAIRCQDVNKNWQDSI